MTWPGRPRPFVCMPTTAETNGLSAPEKAPSHLAQLPGRPKPQRLPPHPIYCCSYGVAAYLIKCKSTATLLRCNASWPEQLSSLVPDANAPLRVQVQPV